MSAVARQLRLATTARLALRYFSAHRSLVVGVAVVLCAASVLLSVVTQQDDDALTAVGRLDSAASSSGTGVGGASSAVRQKDRWPTRRLFTDRPLVLLTISYHAAPIYDLMDQLQPLGVQFIERGINAYACRYFSTCRQDGLLEVVHHERVHTALSVASIKNFHTFYGSQPTWQAVDAFVCLHPAATCELFVPFNRSIIIVTTTRYNAGRKSVADWRRWNDQLSRLAADDRNVIAANNQYDVEYMRYYTGLTPRLLPSRCSYTQATYNPTRRGYLLGLRRDWQFRDFFIDAINSACKALNVSVQLVSIRDLYPTYKWKDLAAHRAIVPVPCQPSMIGIIEQYRMNIPVFLPSKEFLLDLQLGESTMLSGVYDGHATGDTLPVHPSQFDVPDPTVRLGTSIRHWTQLSDWYTTLPHIILYVSFEDLVLRLNRTTLDQLRRVSRLMAQHNARVAHQLRDDWQEILLKVASNSPNHPRPSPSTRQSLNQPTEKDRAHKNTF